MIESNSDLKYRICKQLTINIQKIKTKLTKMYLKQKNLFVIGICLTISVQSVYPFKDDIRILLKHLSNETHTDGIKCRESDSMCKETISNPINTFINKNPIDLLKTLFEPNENTQERKNETIKEIHNQTVNKTTTTEDTISIAIIENNTELNEITTSTINSQEIVNNQEITRNNQTPVSSEINLTDLIPLYGHGGTEIGQKIELQRSHIESDDAITNEAGVEILKNTSEVCGSLLGKRISFANITTLMELPWTALLLYNTKERYHCGGSLITTKYVLTAAHCVAQEFYEL